MAIDPNQYIQQGQSYAAGLAASQDPMINLYRNRLGSMKSREALAAEIANLYSPAIQAAQGVGAGVANVGQAGLAAMSGLASALPGIGVEGLGEAYRGAARAGGSAALLGSVLETGTRQGLAESILQRQMEAQQERFGTEESMAGAESERARLAADYLGAAQGFQGMGQIGQQMQFAAEEQPLKMETMRAEIARINADTSLTDAQKSELLSLLPGKITQQAADLGQTKAQTAGIRQQTKETKENIKKIVKETQSMPAPDKARYYANALAKGEIKATMLTNATLLKDLNAAGYTIKRDKGKTQVIRNGKVIAEI